MTTKSSHAGPPVHPMRRRRRWVWLWILPGILMLLGCWTVVEHFRGKAMLARAMAEATAKHERWMRERMAVPVVTGESNGFPALQLAAAKLATVVTSGPRVAVLIGAKRMILGTQIDRWTLHGSERTNSWEVHARSLDARVADLAAIREALARPIRETTPPRAQAEGKSALDALRTFQDAANALIDAGLLGLRRGSVEETIAALDGVAVIDSDLEGYRIQRALTGWVAIVERAELLRAVAAHRGGWTDAQWEALGRTARPGRMLESAVLVAAEYPLLMATALAQAPTTRLADVYAWDLESAFLGSASDESAGSNSGSLWGSVAGGHGKAADFVAKKGVFPVWRFGWGDQSIAWMLRDADEWVSRARQAATQRSWGSLVDPAWVSGRSGWWTRLFGDLNEQQASQSLASYFRVEAKRALNAAAIAVKRHEAKLGRLPESLDALVPEFASEVPVDWMDGKPLRYRRGEGSEFLLWSVGLDLWDDIASGGPAEDDLIWRLPALREEFEAWERDQQSLFASLGDPRAMLARRYGLSKPVGSETNRAGAPATGAAMPDGRSNGR